MTWQVYGLIDPLTSQVFYVGCSQNLHQRIANHMSDSASAAWRRCQEIKRRGERPEHCIFASSESKAEARIIEARLVLSIPDLVNSKAAISLPLSDWKRDWLDLSTEIRSPRLWCLMRPHMWVDHGVGFMDGTKVHDWQCSRCGERRAHADIDAAA